MSLLDVHQCVLASEAGAHCSKKGVLFFQPAGDTGSGNNAVMHDTLTSPGWISDVLVFIFIYEDSI